MTHTNGIPQPVTGCWAPECVGKTISRERGGIWGCLNNIDDPPLMVVGSAVLGDEWVSSFRAQEEG